MITINKQSSVPVYEQLIAQFERMILLGDLHENDRIPSVRALSLEVSVNPNTVQKAYNELEHHHITYSVPGVGRYVHPHAREYIENHYAKHFDTLYDAAFHLALSGVPETQARKRLEEAYQNAKAYREERRKT